MLNLPNITVICVDGSNNITSIKKSLKALHYSCNGINFGAKVFVTPKILDDELNYQIQTLNIDHYEVPAMNWTEYGLFIIKDLVNYVKTDYCLIVQWDGFVLNPTKWDNVFYEYDYIGATWKDHMIQHSQWVFDHVKRNGTYSLVGNGGFCLRSRRLLQETANAPFPYDGPEDAYICQNYYTYFLDKGIKFAPTYIADKFSRESNESLEWTEIFGFHGEKTMIDRI